MAGLGGILSRIVGGSTPAIFTPRVTYTSSWPEWLDTITGDISQSSPTSLFKKQPHLRTVVSFIARNIAQLGLHSFERVGETDRARDRTSVSAQALAGVDGQMTTYELIYALVGDLMLFDRGYWFVLQDDKLPAGWMIRRLPPTWVAVEKSDPFQVYSYRISRGQESIVVPAAQILAFPGYSPSDPLKGSPAVEALRGTLQEQIEAAAYRAQIWKRGGRVSSVLQRPKEAPEWSDTARERFREDWYSKYTGRGEFAGGTPILEDGMTINRIDFSAQEQQFVEAAKLSLITVASAYHVNPTMIGMNEGANYSNVREFRKMLYGDTLGPIMAQIESRVNTFLLPMLGVDRNRFYVEFNISEKLQGNFEEMSAAGQAAVGAPYMTRNEFRARQNLPRVDGGDELITPMNLVVGGVGTQPAFGGKSNVIRRKSGAISIKAEPTEDQSLRAGEVLRKFFQRQRASVLPKLGAKAPDYWDAERWDSELSDDLYGLAIGMTGEVAAVTLAALGVPVEQYSAARTEKFLKAVADSRAGAINSTTLDQVEASVADPDAAPADVFEQAEGARADNGGVTLATTLVAFATTEAVRQVSPDRGMKTWLTGPKPRPDHAAMDGETVGIDEVFSNGANWPGDPVLGAEGVAGCNCSVLVEVS